MYYNSQDNRTKAWLTNIRSLLAEDIARDVDSVLLSKADTYEYEKIAFPKSGTSLIEKIKQDIESSWRYPKSDYVKSIIHEATQNTIGIGELSERTQKEIALFDSLSEISELSNSTQEDLKRVEKVLFDDDGKHFREIFRKIAGEENV